MYRYRDKVTPVHTNVAVAQEKRTMNRKVGTETNLPRACIYRTEKACLCPLGLLNNYHRLGASDSKHFSLTVLKPGKPKIKAATRLLGRSCFLVGWRMALTWREQSEKLHSRVFYRKAWTPPWELHSKSLISSQMSHLQILSHQGLGVQHKNLGGHKFSPVLIVSNSVEKTGVCGRKTRFSLISQIHWK